MQLRRIARSVFLSWVPAIRSLAPAAREFGVEQDGGVGAVVRRRAASHRFHFRARRISFRIPLRGGHSIASCSEIVGVKRGSDPQMLFQLGAEFEAEQAGANTIS